MDAKSATCINFTKILRNAESRVYLGRFCAFGRDFVKSNKKTQNLRPLVILSE
ncbi:hypothetical protein [Helicobacter sp. 23-1045]